MHYQSIVKKHLICLYNFILSKLLLTIQKYTYSIDLLCTIIIVLFFYNKQNQAESTMINSYEGVCCPCDHIIQNIPNENLICVICYQIMTKPVILECGSGHTYGMACIRQWIKQNKKNTCPYCRKNAGSWKIHQQFKQQVAKLKARCSYCLKWEGIIYELECHHQECIDYQKFLQGKLQKVVQLQVENLDKEINPHLKEKHQDIFNKYVCDWKWLEYDQRDWKWWWWAHNPWWNGSCAKCNNLWHKYEKKIDALQAERKQLLKLLQIFNGSGLPQLFKQQ